MACAISTHSSVGVAVLDLWPYRYILYTLDHHIAASDIMICM